MNSDALKLIMRRAALAFAQRQGVPVDESHASALIFSRLSDCFHPESFQNIIKKPHWLARTQKSHANVPGVKEMQSSNSSDALLMNIFCHPSITKWAGVRKLLAADLTSIDFGFAGSVLLENGQADTTEIDLALQDAFCEAKLTESDFTQKRPSVVEGYANLQKLFHVEALPRLDGNYDNYQIIRNLLAAAQHNRKHLLFCDERRPDLVRHYHSTVSCLRDINLRVRCRVIFWQEIVAVCGASLREWIEERYGMNEAADSSSVPSALDPHTHELMQ